ncbi:transposase [Trichonephila clavata]|uniref:Transposase n=1 Tax=Trichonephila clavata TaxID=2740835 RepID=A0A8X6LI09_TRICU|nr:transposase [Trichonephila clavata]
MRQNRENDLPEKVVIDKSGSNTAALDDLNREISEDRRIMVFQIKYLNNIVEQDHRFIKKRIRPMLGFKSFHSAKITITGIENMVLSHL